MPVGGPGTHREGLFLWGITVFFGLYLDLSELGLFCLPFWGNLIYFLIARGVFMDNALPEKIRDRILLDKDFQGFWETISPNLEGPVSGLLPIFFAWNKQDLFPDGLDIMKASFDSLRALGSLDVVSKDKRLEDYLHFWIVDTLKFLSEKDPAWLRDKIKFAFDDEALYLDWDAYRKEYSRVMGDEAGQLFSELESLSQTLLQTGKRRIVLINATFSGGGVAEMVPGLYKFLRHYGIELEWHIVHPYCPSCFYAVTKKIHNIIQGEHMEISDEEIDILRRVGRDNFVIFKWILEDDSIGAVFFEDPQVVSTLEAFLEYADSFGQVERPWVFRLHIDISGIEHSEENPGARRVWTYIDGVLNRLNELGGILLAQPHLIPSSWQDKERVFAQPPGIDVFSEKNRHRPDEEWVEILAEMDEGLRQLFLSCEPVILTGARADAWKGILQAVEAYDFLRKGWQQDWIPKFLVFAGGADDDPETGEIKRLIEEAIGRSDYSDDIYFVWNARGKQVGALYRLAARTNMPYLAVSIKEGYNLMVDEAIHQGALIITSNAGGLQRFEELGYQWIVDVASDILENADLEDLKDLRSAPSRLLTELIYKQMYSFVSYYKDKDDEYRSEQARLHHYIYSHSLLAMTRDYLKYAVLLRSSR